MIASAKEVTFLQAFVSTSVKGAFPCRRVQSGGFRVTSLWMMDFPFHACRLSRSGLILVNDGLSLQSNRNSSKSTGPQ